MKKIVPCWQCGGTGKTEKEFCDMCKEPNQCGDYEKDGKIIRICHLCWSRMLADEEIMNL